MNLLRFFGLRMSYWRAGRIALHLIAMPLDRKIDWHVRGIIREFI